PPVPLLFFFFSHGPLRYLHSFPTRRSSDLFILSGPLEIASGYIGFAQYLNYLWPGVTTKHGLSLAGSVIVIGLGILCIALLKARSEEHTSELQSRENLVCRLLLEKKKQKLI